MRLIIVLLAMAALAPPVQAREVVDASAPQALSVTVYRDPDRDKDEAMNRDWPRGFAMISETRTVTLPAGESTVRFEGVAEGMVGVSAIVTGLPGGTIEKNRNAELLSPAALVNGALGNRVTITRTNPATGRQVSEQAVVRTRADGGLVLQTGDGFEAVRCAGLPERLTFDRVPRGLSARPVFSIDTRDATGGTYTVTLTYLAWGFDWQANYVGTLSDPGAARDRSGTFSMHLLSWLTLLNDNGQSFEDAELMVVAGTLSVVSDFADLSDPPVAEPLRLTCYPFGSTAAGTRVPFYGPYPPPPPPPPPPAAPAMMANAEAIMVTGSRLDATAQKVRTAQEEQLGDLKLYRVPFPVTVAAKGLKQVAFLNQDRVAARYLYRIGCDPGERFQPLGDVAAPDPDGMAEAEMLLVTRNDRPSGLGVALPQGALRLFEPGERGPHLVAAPALRDYAVDQDIELAVGASTQVFGQCAFNGPGDPPGETAKWRRMRAAISNANGHDARVRVVLGRSGSVEARWPGRKTEVRDGRVTVEVTVPANSTRTFDFHLRETG